MTSFASAFLVAALAAVGVLITILKNANGRFVSLGRFRFTITSPTAVYNVAVLLPDASPAINKIYQNFMRTLYEESSATFICSALNARSSKSRVRWYIQEILEQEYDLILTFGNECTQQALAVTAELESDIPVIYCETNQPNPKFATHGGRAIGVCLSHIDHRRQRSLLKTIKPSVRNIMILTSGWDVDATAEAESLTLAARRENLFPQIVTIHTDLDLLQTLAPHREKRDAVVVGRDPHIGSFIERIAPLCEKFNVPLYTSDLASVESGAIIGFGPREEDSGQAAARAAMALALDDAHPCNLEVIDISHDAKLRFNGEAIRKQSFGLRTALLSLARDTKILGPVDQVDMIKPERIAKVAVVAFAQTPTIVRTIGGFVETLETGTHAPEVDFYCGDGNKQRLTSQLETIVNKGYNLIYAADETSARIAKNVTTSRLQLTPIVFSGVTVSQTSHLISGEKSSGNHLTGVAVPDEYVEYHRHYLHSFISSGLTSLVVPFDASKPGKFKDELSLINAIATKHQINVNAIPVRTSSDVISYIKEYANPGAGLIILRDELIQSCLEEISEICKKRSVTVYCWLAEPIFDGFGMSVGQDEYFTGVASAHKTLLILRDGRTPSQLPLTTFYEPNNKHRSATTATVAQGERVVTRETSRRI